jgi:ATP-dependent Clp protease ATP-binding subunit ClpA
VPEFFYGRRLGTIGFSAERDTVPTHVLGRLAALEEVENAILESVNSPRYTPPAEPANPALPGEARAVGRSAQVADAMGHSYVGVEHLFLAIMRDRDSVPVRALSQVVNPDAAGAAVIEEMNSARYRGEPDPRDAGRVYLPEGTEFDGLLQRAILESLPEGTRFGFNWENGRLWMRVTEPGDTREVLNSALARLGRPGLD